MTHFSARQSSNPDDARCDLSVEIVGHRAAFSVSRNAEFYDWWSRLNGAAAPDWTQFDIVDHPHWAPHLFLVRVESRRPYSYRFRLLGQSVIDLLGRNERLTSLADTGWDIQDSMASRAYDEMMAHQRPLRFFGSLRAYGKGFARFESIDAPFVNEEGEVTAVLGLICRDL